MGLGFDGPGGATAAMGGAVVRTGIMVDSVKGGGGYEGLGWVKERNSQVWESAWDRAERLRHLKCVDRCCRPRLEYTGNLVREGRRGSGSGGQRWR